MISFLSKHPNVSHAFIAAVMMVIILPILSFAGNPISGIFAATMVGVYFFGRESGQNNHDMKNKGASEWKAFWQNIIPVGFTSSNWQQAIVPGVVAFAIGLSFQYFPDLNPFFRALFKI